MNFLKRFSLIVFLCFCLSMTAFAVEGDDAASVSEEAPVEDTSFDTPVVEDDSTTIDSSADDSSSVQDGSLDGDTVVDYDALVPIEDVPVYYLEAADPVSPGYSTYELNPDDVSYSENTMGNVIVSIFGVYQPKTQTVTDHLSDGTSVSYEQIVPGVAGMDWNWIAGVALFALILYSFLKLVGVFLKHD